jgi:hypothetical protein
MKKGERADIISPPHLFLATAKNCTRTRVGNYYGSRSLLNNTNTDQAAMQKRAKGTDGKLMNKANIACNKSTHFKRSWRDVRQRQLL